MTQSFAFSATAILPILFIAVLGFVLQKTAVLNEEFFAFLHKLVFHVALPLLVFLQIYRMDFSAAPKPEFLLFCVVSMTVCYLGGLIVSALAFQDRATAGAMAQGMTRSTFSIVGLPLAEGLFGEAGLTAATVLLPPVLIFNNAFAVIMLSVLSPTKQERGFQKTATKILLGIVKNPLILGMLAALLCKWASIELPTVALETVSSLADTAQPLALLCLGAGFVKESLHGRVRLFVLGSVVKTILLPLIFCTAGILCGFRGIDLGLICILFGGPTTISSYIMAKNMDADAPLTAQIVLLSTVMSAFTLFFAFSLFHMLGLL